MALVHVREYDPDATFYEPFSIEEWWKLGYLDRVNVRLNNLTYPIHPALGFRMWQLTDPPLTDKDKEVMEPALRLASALLMCPASIAFIHALLFEKREPANELRTSRKLEILHGPLRYTRELRPRVEYFLSIAREHFEFTWRDDSLGPPEWIVGQVTYAYTSSYFCDRVPKYGFGSGIRVNNRFLKTLHLLHTAPLSAKNLSHQLRVQFLLAVTICHETMHAIERARERDMHALEPYFGNQALNELGCAWEEAVFDGDITGVVPIEVTESNYTVGEWPLTVGHFPAPAWFATLVRPDEDPDEQEVFDRRPAKGTSTTYFVPMDWLSKLQQQATWDQYEYLNNIKLLHIPKETGYQVPNDLWDIDPDWSPAQSSEGRWPGDARGRVFRNALSRL